MKKILLTVLLSVVVFLINAEEFRTGNVTNFLPADALYFASAGGRAFVSEVSPSATEKEVFALKFIVPALGSGFFTYYVRVNDVLEMAQFPNITQKVKIRITGTERNVITFEMVKN